MAPRSLVHDTPLQPPPEVAILEKGFRPFFLLAALHAFLALPVWVLALTGHVAVEGPWGAQGWHAHEMLFGFTVAVIAGFLLTAAGNWTGRETARGVWLGGIALLWLLSRGAALWDSSVDARLSTLACGAFYVALTVALARPLFATKNRRNYGLLLLVVALAGADIATHLGVSMPMTGWTRLGPLWAVDLVVVMMVLVTGRILPMFTRNATRDPRVVNELWLDRAALGACVASLFVSVSLLEARIAGVVAFLAGALVLLRARRWGARLTWNNPLLWILHAGHTFIGLGLLVRGLSAFFVSVPSSASLHALTAGGIGCLTLGMMSRVTLGHTGRQLLPPRSMVWAFAGVTLGALLRIIAPFIVSLQLPLLTLSAGVWAAGFLVFVLAHGRMLWQPRVDGRSG